MKNELSDALDDLFDSSFEASWDKKTKRDAPGADDGADPSAEWHIEIDDVEVGPLSLGEVGRLVEQGRVDPSTMMWRKGQVDWLRAGDIPDIDALFAAPPIPQARSRSQSQSSSQLASLVASELARDAKAEVHEDVEPTQLPIEHSARAPASLIPEPLPSLVAPQLDQRATTSQSTRVALAAAAVAVVVLAVALVLVVVLALTKPAPVVYVMPPNPTAPATEAKPIAPHPVAAAPAAPAPRTVKPPTRALPPSPPSPPKPCGKDTLWPCDASASKPAADATSERLSKKDVLLVVMHGVPNVKACAAKHGAPAKLTRVGWRVLPNGTVADVRILDGAIAGTPLGTCIAGVVSSWKFDGAQKETLVNEFPLPLQ